ncbi:urease accessory protein UreF [Roseateles amylovorans]|uniref:Urease accessory protein UreF n=1 Tax=Roseateles amylovorans TaxID=2978473 RepID=A0ABY6B8V2_9BURK|nr:urease accessory UreF family protein [Roseateles amylovorans]UXH80814.1 urease accessory protein UreF [Roseateles amylovorans]
MVGTIIPTTTSIDPVPPLLRLVWLASPALPIGAFSYSEGLEAAVEHGHVHDDQSTAIWLTQQLALLARGDLAAIAHGIAAWRTQDEPALRDLADWLRRTRDGAEARLQSEQMGQSLLAWLRPQGMASPAQLALLTDVAAGQSPPYPLVMALALSTVEVPIEQALQAQAFGWAENQVQAALKAVPLGQNAGQRVLARLAAAIPQAVAQAIATPPARRQVFAPMLSILAARHETQYSRLFRS